MNENKEEEERRRERLRQEEQKKAATLEDEISLKLPEKPGTYMYEMETRWSGSDYEGEVTYAIKVKIS